MRKQEVPEDAVMVAVVRDEWVDGFQREGGKRRKVFNSA